ncbi:MAG: acyltransferase [Acidimicrobiia bacterium]|nr:acyltransferase [Acidimicrobiia bacterium]
MADRPTAPHATPFRLGYRPALDGVRGLSVLAVMGYHASLSFLKGGFLGVDAFFVLSGFLITTLLMEEWRGRGGVSLRDFYARRALRLLPAVVLVLLAVAVYAAAFAERGEAAAIWPEAGSTLLYVANWFRVFTDAPFGFHLTHTWSLAIEEQFYVVWPLLLLGLLLLGLSRRARLGVAAAGAALSAVAMVALTGAGAHDIVRAYYGTDTRAQSLLIGCVVGLVATGGILPASARALRRLRTGALVGGAFVLVLWVGVSLSSPFLYRGGFTLEALAVALVVTHLLVAPAGLAARALALGPLVWVGRVSYGLYLWHWPAFLVLSRDRLGLSFWPTTAVRVAVTFALAAVSFYAVERPMLALKARFGRLPDERAAPLPVGAEPVPALA